MATLVQFSKNIRKRKRQAEIAPARTLRRASREALKIFVLGTPVDKGVARSNWRVSIGAPTRSVIRAYSPGKKLGIGERANAGATIAAGNAVIDKLRPGRGRQNTKALFIVNSTPYIERLNRGYSGQSAGMFIEQGLAAARRRIRLERIFRDG